MAPLIAADVWQSTVTLGTALTCLLLALIVVAGLTLIDARTKRRDERLLISEQHNAELLQETIRGGFATVGEKLDSSLRAMVLTDGRAKESIASLHDAVSRVEAIEFRLNGNEHRITVVERYQQRILDAEARLRNDAEGRVALERAQAELEGARAELEPGT